MIDMIDNIIKTLIVGFMTCLMIMGMVIEVVWTMIIPIVAVYYFFKWLF